MKITILNSHAFRQGGCEKYTLRLAKAFAKEGNEVSILTTIKPNEHLKLENEPNIEIVNLGVTGQISYLHLEKYDAKCQAWIKLHKPQVVFGMDRNSFQTHYRAGNGVHAEYLNIRKSQSSLLKSWSFSINPLHLKILKFEKQTYQNPNLKTLFTNSQLIKNEIIRHYNTDENKIKVVHNGVEWHEMANCFADWPFIKDMHLKERQLDGSSYQFLFVGHGYRRKGLGYLLKALADKRIKRLPWQLSVVGKDKELKLFQNLAVQLEIEKKVKFFGPRNDVRTFYQMSDCLVIPSTYDPFANVTVEALAMGLHVLSSARNGGSEILTTMNGVVIEELSNIDEFVKKLLVILEKGKKTLKSANEIRNGVAYLDFGLKLREIVEATID